MRRFEKYVTGGLLSLALLIALIVPGGATAAYSHSVVEGTFSVGTCSQVNDIAVDEHNGYVYAVCAKPYPENYSIKRYTLSGAPAPFSATKPYISGNVLTGDPGGAHGKFEREYNPQIAVDNSNSPNQGRLFVTNTPNVDVFNPSGEFFTAIVQPVESTIPNQFGGVDVGPDGFIYITSHSPGDRISKYNPSFQEVERLYGSNNDYETDHFDSTHIQVDSTGAVWSRLAEIFEGNPRIVKYEVDQFTTELQVPAFGATPEQLEPFVADPSPYAPDPLLGGFAALFDVDTTTNDLYVDRGNRIETYSQGTPEETAYRNAPTFGAGKLSNSRAVAVTADHHVYASSQESPTTQRILIFGPGDVLPEPHTYPADPTGVGHTDATVRGRIELAGGDPVTECFVEYGTQAEYEAGDYNAGTAPCVPDAAGTPYTQTTEVSAHLTGLTTGATYHYRFVAGNGHGTNAGIDRSVIAAYVIGVQTLEPEDVNTSGATFKGSFDPDGMPTTYHFEYGIDTDYGLSTPSQPGGSASGEVVVGQPVTGLPTGRIFHYRLVAENANGTTYGQDVTFRTGSSPDVSGVRASEVTASSALLQARIDPVGFDTTYYFEYGRTNAYGQRIPLSPEDIGSGKDPVDVSQRVEGLEYGVTYHYRVVAENQWGKTTSGDTTFDYSPPRCPNDHVRQQTGSSYLPDCRAYELVSPGTAGAVLLYPTFAATKRVSNEYNPFREHAIFPQNRGFASAPSRFAFFAGVGTVNGIYSPDGIIDMYMSTRTTDGWVTTLPGLRGDEVLETGRKECSDALDLCTDHTEAEYAGFKAEYAPYLFTAAGEKLGRLPTNYDVIPGADKFHGQQRMSGDFSHFVFGSAERLGCTFCGEPPLPAVPFTPDAVTTGMGSLYDNDIAARTVSLVSKLPNGDPLPEEVHTDAGIQIPGLSADGSHILMQTPAAGGLAHLFMRVDDAVTYDVSEGAAVKPIGMTRDGSQVFFTTAAKLVPQDSDGSVDLYAWKEATHSVQVLSQGNGHGNSDACPAAWDGGTCDVKRLTPEYGYPDGNNYTGTSNAMDDLFAEGSGDVYFYSPELLDGSRPGIENQRNLYVFRNGAPQLVATFDPGTEASRMQISPDGEHAAFVTASRLTPYDNDGFKEMYTFDAATGEIKCASCHPDGTPPHANVVASQGGRFMSDDGRAFFTTSDSLVPRDKNGKINDVYEYVNGRPQLITSGLGSRDFTGGSETLSLLLPAVHTGLEAVSRKGQDVYFSTYETLVSEDHNGQFVKFYDARTNGGFPNDPAPAPCAAADECHGESSAPPAPAITATGSNLGKGGNVVPKKAAKKAKRHRRHHKKKKNRRKAHRPRGARTNG